MREFVVVYADLGDDAGAASADVDAGDALCVYAAETLNDSQYSVILPIRTASALRELSIVPELIRYPSRSA